MTFFTIAIHIVDPPLYSFPVVAGKKNLLEKISLILNVIIELFYLPFYFYSIYCKRHFYMAHG